MTDHLANVPVRSHLWQLYQKPSESIDLTDLPSVHSSLEHTGQVSEWSTNGRELTAGSISTLRIQSGPLTRPHTVWTPTPLSAENSQVSLLKSSQTSRITLVAKSGRQVCQIQSCTAAMILSLCLLCCLAIAVPIGLVYGLTTSKTTTTTLSSTSAASTVTMTTTVTASTTSTTSSSTSSTTTSSTSTSTSTSTSSTTTSSTSTSTSTTASTSTSTSTTSTTSPNTAWMPSNYNQTCSNTCSNVTTVTPSTLLASWPFEQTANDVSGNGYDGLTVNEPIYTAAYIGQGLTLQSNLSQHVNAAYMNLVNSSFTVEVWIYLNSLSPTGDLDILGECAGGQDKCLHYLVRSSRLYMGFLSDDLAGTTNLITSVWYHAAFVYDLSVNRKSIYLNGVLDGTSISLNPYQGQSGNLTIGSTGVGTATSYWNGVLDQLTISNRAKSACEILNDASLIIHLPFNNIFDDIGPNTMSVTYNPQANGGLSWVTGSVNQALNFNATVSYVESCGIFALGLNHAYSIALWINPSFQGGTLVHLASGSGGSSFWCLPMIGFTSNGSLVAQTWNGAVVTAMGPIPPIKAWTHIVKTWSPTNGLRLYINGGLFSSTPISTFSSSGLRMCVLLGTSSLGTNCATDQLLMGSYAGAIDEVYVYSRELTAAEVCPLAHP